MTFVAAAGLLAAVAFAVAWVRERRHRAAVELAADTELAEAHEERDAERTEAERMRRAVDALPLGVQLHDPDGAVVYRNRSAIRLATARRTEALVTATIDELVRGALEGATDRRTVEIYGPPQRTLVIEAAPLDSNDPRLGAITLIDDVSERRRLEAVRRDFVANISHELKTPVGAISLLAETLLGEEDQEVVERLAERVLAEALRVGRTIDDLLELSRIEIDELPEFAVVGVAEVTTEAIQRIRPAAEQASISLLTGPIDPDLAIVGDRRQLVSALYNLLDNAVKYSDRGSSVEVEVHETGESVEIVVCDHGIGIPGRDLDRIFERFYRVDRARSRETGGTGLGLAIVRHVAVNHDGDVRVESRQGDGSTFTLVLPKQPVPVSPPTPEHATSGRTQQ